MSEVNGIETSSFKTISCDNMTNMDWRVGTHSDSDWEDVVDRVFRPDIQYLGNAFDILERHVSHI